MNLVFSSSFFIHLSSKLNGCVVVAVAVAVTLCWFNLLCASFCFKVFLFVKVVTMSANQYFTKVMQFHSGREIMGHKQLQQKLLLINVKITLIHVMTSVRSQVQGRLEWV